MSVSTDGSADGSGPLASSRLRAAPVGGVEEIAGFVSAAAGREGRVLHAGCGNGRVAAALAALDHPVLGVDNDLDQLRGAAERSPRIPFWLSELAELDVPQAAIGAGFDAVLVGDATLSRLASGSLPAVLAQLALVTKPGGAVVACLPREALPATDQPSDGGAPARHEGAGSAGAAGGAALREYDAAAVAAGLLPDERYADWGRAPLTAEASYVVVVHRRPEPREDAGVVARLRDRLRRRP